MNATAGYYGRSEFKRQCDFLDAIFYIFVFGVILSLLSCFAFGGDTPRYSVIKPDSVAQIAEPQIKPVPDPRFTRPLVYFYIDKSDLEKPAEKWHCQACRQLWQAIERGELPYWSFEKRERPEWVNLTPTLHFERGNGTWWNYPRTAEDYDGPNGFRKAYLSQCPSFAPMLAEISAAKSAPMAGDAGSLEMFRQFAGESGRITFSPDKPVSTTMDDGTRIAYKSITGTYAYNNGRPTFTIDGDKPQMSAKKFLMRFGLTLNDVGYDPPSSISVGTSRGRFSIKLEPQK